MRVTTYDSHTVESLHWGCGGGKQCALLKRMSPELYAELVLNYWGMAAELLITARYFTFDMRLFLSAKE